MIDFSILNISWWLWLTPPLTVIILMLLGSVRTGVNVSFRNLVYPISRKENSRNSATAIVLNGLSSAKNYFAAPKTREHLFMIPIGILPACFYAYMFCMLFLGFSIFGFGFTYALNWLVMSLLTIDTSATGGSLVFMTALNTALIIFFSVSEQYDRIKAERDAMKMVITRMLKGLEPQGLGDPGTMTHEQLVGVLNNVEEEVRSGALIGR
jgi:hypothetical protein